MFDSLRGSKDDSSFFDEQEQSNFRDYLEAPPAPRFLGMTAGQRFVVALLLFGTVAVVGLLCLLVTEKVLIF